MTPHRREHVYEPGQTSWLDKLADWVAFLLVGWLLLIIILLFPRGHK